MIKQALISVSDKTGVLEFARALSAMGVNILSTGGTAKLLADNGVPVTEVADYTGFLYVDTNQGGRTGYLVEFGDSHQIFQNPIHDHTKQYIRGEFS